MPLFIVRFVLLDLLVELLRCFRVDFGSEVVHPHEVEHSEQSFVLIDIDCYNFMKNLLLNIPHDPLPDYFLFDMNCQLYDLEQLLKVHLHLYDLAYQNSLQKFVMQIDSPHHHKLQKLNGFFVID